MRNKKWKRKAKRLMGKCRTITCDRCDLLQTYFCEDKFVSICAMNVPVTMGIRELENKIKIY